MMECNVFKSIPTFDVKAITYDSHALEVFHHRTKLINQNNFALTRQKQNFIFPYGSGSQSQECHGPLENLKIPWGPWLSPTALAC